MAHSLRTYQLHYYDGHVESREAFGYTDAGPYIVFHQLEDKSDLDTWEHRPQLLMISEDEAGLASDATCQLTG